MKTKLNSKKLLIWSSLILVFYMLILPIIAGYVIPSKPYGFESNMFSFLIYWFWGGVILLVLLVLFNLSLWLYKKK